MENDFIDITKLNAIHVESYIKKENFIELLNNLKFDSIKSARIEFNTGYEYDAKENTTKTRGFEIEIS